MSVFAVGAAAMVAYSAMKLAQKRWELSARMLALHSLLVVFGLLTFVILVGL